MCKEFLPHVPFHWRITPLLLAVILLLSLAACHDGETDDGADAPPAEAFDHTVAKAWMDLAYTLVKTQPGNSPPVASRLYAYASVALYEAMGPGATAHRSLAGQLNGLTAEAMPAPVDAAHHWPAVANRALATMLTSFFPAGRVPAGCGYCFETSLIPRE